MTGVVAVADDPAVGSSVILERAGEARAGAHIGGTVLLDGVKRVGANPDRMGCSIITDTCGQSIAIVSTIHRNRQTKLTQAAAAGGSPRFLFRGRQHREK